MLQLWPRLVNPAADYNLTTLWDPSSNRLIVDCHINMLTLKSPNIILFISFICSDLEPLQLIILYVLVIVTSAILMWLSMQNLDLLSRDSVWLTPWQLYIGWWEYQEHGKITVILIQRRISFYKKVVNGHVFSFCRWVKWSKCSHCVSDNPTKTIIEPNVNQTYVLF